MPLYFHVLLFYQFKQFMYETTNHQAAKIVNRCLFLSFFWGNKCRRLTSSLFILLQFLNKDEYIKGIEIYESIIRGLASYNEHAKDEESRAELWDSTLPLLSINSTQSTYCHLVTCWNGKLFTRDCWYCLYISSTSNLVYIWIKMLTKIISTAHEYFIKLLIQCGQNSIDLKSSMLSSTHFVLLFHMGFSISRIRLHALWPQPTWHISTN